MNAVKRSNETNIKKVAPQRTVAVITSFAEVMRLAVKVHSCK